MNDPNGLVVHEGTYHLFYQYNPEGSTWAMPHWGHAASKDLFRWRDQGIALYPDPSLGPPFSGSVVTDLPNTSGLCGDGPCLVAVYTTETVSGDGSPGLQQQCIAVSRNGGDAWEPYDHNPVIENPGRFDFRDPKVFRYAPHDEWKMVVAAGDRIYLYGSKNLRTWRFLSDFGGMAGSHDGEWECPDLFPIVYGTETKWVLSISVGRLEAPSVLAVQYFIGDFDGTRFTASHGSGWADSGHDFYAAQSWHRPDSSKAAHRWIAWMGRWSYAERVPTRPWRGAMTIPRELGLMEIGTQPHLTQWPVEELCTFRRVDEVCTVAPGRLHRIPGGAPFEVSFEYAIHPGMRLTVEILYEYDELLLLTVDHRAGEVRVDRSRIVRDLSCAPNELVAHARIPQGMTGLTRMLAVVDRSSAEVFVADGTVVLTEQIFPRGEATAIHMSVDDAGRSNLHGVLYPLTSGRSPG
jgi:fructan beta-fructosidase